MATSWGSWQPIASRCGMELWSPVTGKWVAGEELSLILVGSQGRVDARPDHWLLVAHPGKPGPSVPLADTTLDAGCRFRGDRVQARYQLAQLADDDQDCSGLHRISEAQHRQFRDLLEKIETEARSSSPYRADAVDVLLVELLYLVVKVQRTNRQPQGSNGEERLLNRFEALLLGQFPLRSPDSRLSLRTPSDFSRVLAVHVNHLNRVLRRARGLSTSEWIAREVYREAERLLSETHWTVSEVAFALGYQDPSHFGAFFRNRSGLAPGRFRTHALV